MISLFLWIFMFLKQFVIYISFVFLFSLSAFAEDLSLRDLIKKDLVKFSKVLSRDVSIFSWTSKKKLVRKYGLPNSKSIEFNHQAFGEYAKTEFDSFFTFRKMKFKTNHLGHGLYAYHEMFGSKSYGNTLIEIIVPKGSRYLELRHGSEVFDREIKLSEKTIKALKNELKCKKVESALFGTFDGTPFYSVDKNQLMKCKARALLFKEVFSELNIAFVTYIWRVKEKKTSYCPKSTAGYTAMVFVAGKWSDKVQVNGFMTSFSNEYGNKHMKAYESIHMYSRAFSKRKPGWKFFENQEINQTHINKVKSKFGCGFNLEDNLSF